MKKLWYFIIVLCFLGCSVNNTNISGTVDDTDTGIALYGRVINKQGDGVANVVAKLTRIGFSDTSDHKGYYSIKVSRDTLKKLGIFIDTLKDTIQYLKDSSPITTRKINKWIDTLPDVYIIQRNIYGKFHTSQTKFKRIEAILSCLDDTAFIPKSIPLWYFPATYGYSGFAYFINQNCTQNYLVYIKVFSADSLFTGRSRDIPFSTVAGDIEIPTFDPTNAIPILDAGNDTIVSINDTIKMHVLAIDSFGGHISQWEWNINNSGWFTSTNGDKDLVMPAKANPAYSCSVRVTDNDGNVVKTVRMFDVRVGIPVVVWYDTMVSIHDTIKLKPVVTDSFGTIVKWEWNIGNSGWVEGSTGDTEAVMPAYADTAYRCSVRVTDDDGNIVKAARKIDVRTGLPCIVWNDTIVSVNSIFKLKPVVCDSFGIIVKWEWNIGDSGWVFSSKGDTDVVMPAGENHTYACSVRVTDDDGNVVVAGICINVFAPVSMVSGGANYSLILKTDNTLFGCGWNNDGQLSSNADLTNKIPVQVMNGVKSMAAGNLHSLILKSDNTLYTCGRNDCGQLGDGTTTNQHTPVQIMTDVSSMAAGGNHSLILKIDGTLYACGKNDYGQLGDGTTTNQPTPVQIMTGASSMAAGGFHSLILKTDGTLYACGRNDYGQLGDGTATNQPTPVQIMTGVSSMAAGGFHSLILKTDGTLYACGNNDNGQLGDGSGTTQPKPVRIMANVQKITGATSYSLILKTDNTLYACGENGYGQLGDGTTINRWAPVQIMNNVMSMNTGWYHSLFLKNNGTLFACGWNSGGQLGDGTTFDRITPVRIIPPLK